ncbi:putative Ig domain-containing protein [Actinospongicola halichondriae]|uniref:putative Ig domain-containing protein n=1 Tax=Actinospongicola halichondriae TaxID=3236844 RepID=UPI003D456E56
MTDRLRSSALVAVLVAILLSSTLIANATSDDTTDAPISEAAASDDAGDSTSDDVVTDDTRPPLVVDAPSNPVLAERFELTVSTDAIDGASALEGVVRFDDTNLTLTDVRTDDDARVLVVRRTDGAAFAALPCADDSCDPAPDVTLAFAAARAGDFAIDLLATLVVDAAGNAVDHAPPTTTVVTVGDAGSQYSSLAEVWDADRMPEAPATDRLDISGDGVVSSIDLTEGVIAWNESRTAGDPCTLDPTSAAADLNEDGCADVSDLQALTRAVTTSAVGAGIAEATPTDSVTTGDDAGDPSYQGIRTGLTTPAATRSGASFASTSLPIAPTPAAPTVHVVTTTNDGYDTQTNDGVCVSNLGDGCSLRAAILQARATAGPDRIEFDIPGAGTQTINLTSRLPTINDTTGAIVIDGYTQPGSAPNTSALTSNAVIKVQVRGIGYNNGGAAFTISSGGNVIRGLAIYDAFYGIEIVEAQAVGNQILGNFIGTNAAGTYGLSSGFTLGAGVWLNNGPTENHIGTPALADRNVISGNRTVGVKAEHARTKYNVVQNNIIGMNPATTAALPNNAGFDLQWHSTDQVIGGTGPNEGNLISGNSYTGIDLSHTTRFNQILGNRIGTAANGITATTVTGNADGILIKDNPFGNVIAHNVISGNDHDGIWGKHNYTDANTIRDNLIGVGLDGSPVPNRDWGIWLTGESDLITRNVIAHNDDGGIYVNNSNGANNSYPPELTRQNRITDNSFYGNGGLAIDIEPVGPNPNDPGDADEGVHNLLNFPEITAFVPGHLEGTACIGCSVEVYIADASTDSHGEGRQRIAAITTGAEGEFSLDHVALTNDVPITLLAIDAVGNTSEFGPRTQIGETLTFTPTALTGAFHYVDISGIDHAIVDDDGYRNDGGPSGTSSSVVFDFSVPTAGTYVVAGGIYAPSGSSNSFWVQMDGAPSSGIYWSTPTQSGIQQATVGASTGPDPYPFDLTAGAHTMTFFLREDGIGLANITLIPLSAENAPPVVTDPGPLSNLFGEAVDVTIAASDPDGDVLTYFASGLPAGIEIDLGTGRLTGTTSAGGTYAPKIHVFDGVALTTLTLDWTVAPPNTGPVFTDPGPQAIVHNAPASVQIQATDPDTDPITWSATGLPAGLTIAPDTGLVTGAPTTLGTVDSVVTATDGAHPTTLAVSWTVTPAPFACAVDGENDTVSWTDQGASVYYVRHHLNGASSYVGSSNGLEYTVTDLDGTYEVHFYKSGVKTITTCDGPGNPPFVCAVDGDTHTLSWSDEGASKYHVRHLLDGTWSYIGSNTELARIIGDLDGTYEVHYYAAGVKVATTCDGPGDPVLPPFECSIDGETSILSWNDQEASVYYVRHILGESNTYVGSSNGLEFPITDLDGTYEVHFYKSGVKTPTTCDGPGNPVTPPFECSIDDVNNILSWTDEGASVYYVRHIVGATDTYVGSSNGLELAITDPAGTYLVRYWTNGVKTDTTCTLTP